MQVVDRKTTYTADSSVNKMNQQVSLSVSIPEVNEDGELEMATVGVINLSGVYKGKNAVEAILQKWGKEGVNATVVTNDKGQSTGFKLVSKLIPEKNTGHLIGFYNPFEDTTLVVATAQLRSCRNFAIHLNTLTKGMLDGL